MRMLILSLLMFVGCSENEEHQSTLDDELQQCFVDHPVDPTPCCISYCNNGGETRHGSCCCN